MSARRSVALRLLVLWGLFILYGTTLPFDLSPSWEGVVREWRDAHSVPWRAPDGGLPSLPDAVANVLLFLPWGFLVGWEIRRRGGGSGRAMLLGAGSALAASLTVEFLQLFSSTRTTSSTDLVTNTTGGALGAWLGASVRTHVGGRAGDLVRSLVATRPAQALAIAVAGGVLLHAVEPFDVSLDVGAFKASVKATRLVPFGPPLRGPTPEDRPGEAAEAVLAWMLIGGTAAFALRPRTGLAVASVVVLAIAAEASQLFIRSRTPDATTVLWAGLGGAVGAGLVARAAGREARRWAGPALLIWLAAALLEGLSPGRFAWPDPEDFSWLQLLPFIHYFLRTNIYALADAVMQALVYLPAGFLVALRGGSRPIRSALIFGLAAAGVVEAGQILLPARVADVTDVALGGLGAALGAWILERARDLRRVRAGTGTSARSG